VLAMSYPSSDRIADASLKGRISRHAWGDDYHISIKHRLERLLQFIKSQDPSAQGICYVDTGPIMEKVWGARTTIGWTGKHSILVSRERGSWFFLGIILLDIELEYDRGEKNYCGKCRRCIEACPTGAIVAPYVLDARLCISYLTLEFRGPIPRHLRSLMGNRIYGCDTCQESCPWNRFAESSLEKECNFGEDNRAPDLIPLLRLTPEEFENRFSRSSIRRLARDGFVRNVAVALGNSGAAEAIPVLEEALHDASPIVRSHAAWALGQIASIPAQQTLKAARLGESDEVVLEEIIAAQDFAIKRPASN
jgi:epoxyqueuosine reductase